MLSAKLATVPKRRTPLKRAEERSIVSDRRTTPRSKLFRADLAQREARLPPLAPFSLKERFGPFNNPADPRKKDFPRPAGNCAFCGLVSHDLPFCPLRRTVPEEEEKHPWAENLINGAPWANASMVSACCTRRLLGSLSTGKLCSYPCIAVPLTLSWSSAPRSPGSRMLSLNDPEATPCPEKGLE